MTIASRPNAKQSQQGEDEDDSSRDSPLLVDAATAQDGMIMTTTSTDKKTPLPASRAAASLKPLDRLRRFLKFYVSFVSTASHQDQALKLLQWTLWLLSTTTRNEGHERIYQKYSGDISYARYATRLLGLPAALEALLTGSWSAATSSTSTQYAAMLARLGRWTAAGMVGYYPTEHAAYALWMMPAASAAAVKFRRNRTAERLSAWSCRFWFVYIVSEMTQCALQWKELRQKPEEPSTEETDGAVTDIQLQLARNALFLLPCIHWSLPNWDRQPWLPAKFVNTLMWVESVTCLYQSLRRLQQQQLLPMAEAEEALKEE
jgi:hypothetical protein